MAHIQKVRAHHLLGLCSLLNNLSLVSVFVRLQQLEPSPALRWRFGVTAHFWLPKPEGLAALKDTTKTLIAASLLQAFRELFLYLGQTKIGQLKKCSTRLPCFSLSHQAGPTLKPLISLTFPHVKHSSFWTLWTISVNYSSSRRFKAIKFLVAL